MPVSNCRSARDCELAITVAEMGDGADMKPATGWLSTV
jgi:hypothetical protein